jgi:hypothetical protein
MPARGNPALPSIVSGGGATGSRRPGRGVSGLAPVSVVDAGAEEPNCPVRHVGVDRVAGANKNTDGPCCGALAESRVLVVNLS